MFEITIKNTSKGEYDCFGDVAKEVKLTVGMDATIIDILKLVLGMLSCLGFVYDSEIVEALDSVMKKREVKVASLLENK